MSFFIAGFIGGILRGSVGLIKYLTSFKNVEIRPRYFIGTVILSGIVGFVSAWIAQDIGKIFLDVPALPVSFALLAGYAGGDFVENIIKIAYKESQLYRIGSKLKEVTVIKK